MTVTTSADRLLQSTPITQLLKNTPIADCSTICNQPYLQSITLWLWTSQSTGFSISSQWRHTDESNSFASN